MATNFIYEDSFIKLKFQELQSIEIWKYDFQDMISVEFFYLNIVHVGSLGKCTPIWSTIPHLNKNSIKCIQLKDSTCLTKNQRTWRTDFCLNLNLTFEKMSYVSPWISVPEKVLPNDCIGATVSSSLSWDWSRPIFDRFYPRNNRTWCRFYSIRGNRWWRFRCCIAYPSWSSDGRK